MSIAVAVETAAFHIALHASDLERSLRFYRALLGREPDAIRPGAVRFVVEEPPVMLDIVQAVQQPGGTLNHVGLRLPDAPALVEVQRRLEEAGIATQRQEGVECCYAQQSKFWATDPDRNLWELYVLERDLDHSGFEDAPRPQAVAPQVVWEHRLMQPMPERLPHADGSVDEVRLEGSWNAKLEQLRPAALLTEFARVLRPGGKVVIHGMVGNRAWENPTLPGLAGLVQRVPALTEVLEALGQAGFTAFHYDTLGDITCLPVGGLELFEMRLAAWRAPADGVQRVLYKGPLARVVADDGTVLARGVPATVAAAVAQALAAGPAAGQFLFFPTEA